MDSPFHPLSEATAAKLEAPADGPARIGRSPALTTHQHPDWLRTRRQLRRAAARLIRERGVIKATPRAIVRAARLSGVVLSDCYPTREALMADIMLHHLDGLTCWVLAARDAAAQDDAASQLEAMIGAYLASALAERDEHRLLLRAADVLARKERDKVRLRCDGLLALFAETLAETVKDAAPAALKLAAMTLVSALSCAVLWFDPDGTVAVSGYARMLVDMAVEGARS
jgi:AcrR family transcriptional regulator